MAHSTLNLKQKLTLCRWLEGNAPKFPDMTRQEVTELATKELGFRITDNNIYGAISGAGLKLTFRRSRFSSDAKQRAVSKNGYTAAALRDLMTTLGYPVPAYLNAVITGESLDVVDGLYNRSHNRTSS